MDIQSRPERPNHGGLLRAMSQQSQLDLGQIIQTEDLPFTGPERLPDQSPQLCPGRDVL